MKWQRIDEYDIGYNNMYHDLRKFIEAYAEDDSDLEPIEIDSIRAGYSGAGSLYSALRYTVRKSKYSVFIDVSRSNGKVTISKIYCPIVKTQNSQVL